MIPTIGLMIGSYIIFRCFDLLCRGSGSFVSTAARSLMQVLAIILILLTGSLIYDLHSAGSAIPPMPGLGR